MNNNIDKKKNWIFLFLPILILCTISSLPSLKNFAFYYRDSGIMAVKSHYLDLINLGLVIPIGIIMFILAIKNIYWAKLFILGIMANLAFMFGFNALSLFFNEFFLIYVAILGLNIFGLILGYSDVKQSGNYNENPIKMKISSVILFLFGMGAATAWLLEIISATVNNTIAHSISGMNLPVNVVHVFDLSFALPVIIIGAIKLFTGKKDGLIISTIMAVFVIFVCVSILGMQLGLQYKNMPVDTGELYSVSVFSLLTIFPLVTLIKAVSKRSL